MDSSWRSVTSRLPRSSRVNWNSMRRATSRFTNIRKRAWKESLLPETSKMRVIDRRLLQQDLDVRPLLMLNVISKAPLPRPCPCMRSLRQEIPHRQVLCRKLRLDAFCRISHDSSNGEKRKEKKRKERQCLNDTFRQK